MAEEELVTFPADKDTIDEIESHEFNLEGSEDFQILVRKRKIICIIKMLCLSISQ